MATEPARAPAFTGAAEQARRWLGPVPGERLAWGLLVSSYLFGTLMLGHRIHDGFVYLTAPHLLLSAALLLSAHRPRGSARVWLWVVLCAVIGWGAEYVGVHGGWLFGSYLYGDVLGPKLWAIPLVIGINWVLVVYAVCATLTSVAPHWPRWAKAGVAAIALVALDFLIEPVAIELDFWTWSDGVPPLRNYVGWLGVGLVQASLFYLVLPFTENRLAPVLLLLQVAFFGYLNLTLAN